MLSIDSSSFFLDTSSSVLHRYDGDASDVPLIDDVVAMEVRYYGATQPPVWPRPPAGEANCLYDAGGAYQAALMPALAGVAGLVEMTGAMLSDGPWCGSGGTRFDADLLRVRRIRISVRLQASDPAVRGSDRQRFFNPGTGASVIVYGARRHRRARHHAEESRASEQPLGRRLARVRTRAAARCCRSCC